MKYKEYTDGKPVMVFRGYTQWEDELIDIEEEGFADFMDNGDGTTTIWIVGKDAEWEKEVITIPNSEIEQ